MKQGPPGTHTPESGPKILSFEEFILRDSLSVPRYNNFFLRFVGGFYSFYKKTDYYKKFMSGYPKLEKELCRKIQSRDEKKGDLETFKPFEKDLYEAYKIMRNYGASDRDLFS